MRTVTKKAIWRDDRPKAYRVGTHRVEPPETTLDRAQALFRTIGVTRLGEITGLDRIGIPVAQAVRPMGRSLSVAQGKGATKAAALVSAAMEAAETWHAENLELPTVTARRRVLAASERTVGLAGLSARRDLPEAELNEQPMTWIPGVLLADGAEVEVPFDSTTMDFTRSPETSFLVRSSNGLASGVTLAEAAAASILELIERDCVADFHFMDPSERATRRVPDPALAAADAAAAIARSGARLDVWDITNDIDVPAFLARVSEPRRSETWHALSPSAGSGAHLDPEVALQRAIHEAVQSRATRMAGARDDLGDADYSRASDVHHVLVLDAMFDAGAARPKTHADSSCETSAGDVEVLLRRLARAGLEEVALVDLSRSGTGLAVVRTVVPGLAIALPHNRYLQGSRRSLQPAAVRP